MHVLNLVLWYLAKFRSKKPENVLQIYFRAHSIFLEHLREPFLSIYACFLMCRSKKPENVPQIYFRAHPIFLEHLREPFLSIYVCFLIVRAERLLRVDGRLAGHM
jgi:hypothetical protein